MSEQLQRLVQEVTPLVVELRRELHRIPEPGFAEFRTTALLARFLQDHGVQPELRHDATGLWVDIGESPVVGFRADIDSLPIIEPEDNDPRSENEGWMHACGHDAHSAIAAGVAVVLSRLDLPRGIRIIFQPAEERLPGGARHLIAEGLIDGLETIVAFHVDPTKEAGTIGLREGAITASADGLGVILTGPGGHTSRPQRTVDLVSVAADLISRLPARIRAEIDPEVPAVIAFGSVHGGDAANVIPTEITIRGTVRTGDRGVWLGLPHLVEDLVGEILAGSGAGFRVDYVQGVAPVVNDPEIIRIARQAISRQLGVDAVVATEPSMGGEDFADYLELIPGALLRLGTRSDGGDIHSASFRINEEAIGFGVHAATAILTELLELGTSPPKAGFGGYHASAS